VGVHSSAAGGTVLSPVAALRCLPNNLRTPGAHKHTPENHDDRSGMHAHLQVLALRAKKTHIRGAEEEFQVCWQASARIIIKRFKLMPTGIPSPVHGCPRLGARC
jgi:hypothetical protein